MNSGMTPTEIVTLENNQTIVLPQYPDVHIRLIFAEKKDADVSKRIREILKRSYIEHNAVS